MTPEALFVAAARTAIGTRIGGHRALVTMCIGGGQGIAAIFDRV